MANDEHLARLKQGVAAWNVWRDKNPNISPDLTGADLSGANLGGANLRRAELSGANLRRAKLGDANLSGAKLTGADLTGANLNGADLTGADLTGAKLGADLSDGRDANMMETVFGNVDLTSVIGLETCEHYGPSIIDHRTLERSGRCRSRFFAGSACRTTLSSTCLRF